MTEQSPIKNPITLSREEQALLDARQKGIYHAVEQFKKHAFGLEIHAGVLRDKGFHRLGDETEAKACAVRDAVREVVTMLRAELLSKSKP